MGRVLLANDRAVDAIPWLEQAIKSPLATSEAHELLGLAYSKTNRNVEAAAELQTAIHVDPKSARLHLMLARIYRALGDTAKSRSRAVRVHKAESERYTMTRRSASSQLFGSSAAWPVTAALCAALLSRGVPHLYAQSCDSHNGIQFSEKAQPYGIDFHHSAHHSSMSYPLEVMGSGVALFDYDNDGRLDIFLANGAAFPDPNTNKDAPRKAGPGDWNASIIRDPTAHLKTSPQRPASPAKTTPWASAVGDYDNDGDDDLFVAGFPHNHLYHNNGNGTFADVTADAGLAGYTGWSTSAAWVDLDQDGRLDLVVLRYFKWNFDDRDCPTPDGKRSYCDPKIFPLSSRLFITTTATVTLLKSRAKSE